MPVCLHEWELIGGNLTSGPAVTSVAKGRIDVFVRHSDRTVWLNRLTDGDRADPKWSGWVPYGTQTLEPALDACSIVPDNLHVFGQCEDDGDVLRILGQERRPGKNYHHLMLGCSQAICSIRQPLLGVAII